MRPALAGLAAAALIAALVAACGGSGPMARTSANRTDPTTYELWNASPEVKRARIETLEQEIAAGNDDLERSPAPAVDPDRSPMVEPGTAPSSDPGGASACVRSARPVCQDVCSLSDSICDASDEICRLAESLPGDEWAAGKCTAGRESCARARQRCCGC